MNPSFAHSLDTLGAWRSSLLLKVGELGRSLGDHDLLDGEATAHIDALKQRLASDKLVVAFVAEFSRGKSELINAIFFADAGRRVLPATPGRTTMCPVELGYEAGDQSALALLPIDTRTEGRSLVELRQQARAWKRIELDPDSPQQLADALREVMRTKRVDLDQARLLGFWSDDADAENPPVGDDGRVEIPAWRHALINYPHPLLKRGLVVLDTPGLNAIGAEPELTLSLLPSAHATVFILGADTGVTKSDLAIWRDHLGSQADSRFVVLNKIDTLNDPLASADEVRSQIVRQCESTAAALGVSMDRVFPLSARQALAARVEGDAQALNESRLPELEAALDHRLLPQRRHVLEQAVLAGVGGIEAQVSRQLSDRRRQIAEQVFELRGLRGKSSPKVKLMLQRIDAETDEFERCTSQLQAIRLVHSRMLKDALIDLSSDRLRDEVGAMQRAVSTSLFGFGAKKAFNELCARLRGLLTAGSRHADEMHKMLSASYTRLNTEFGFSLNLARGPELDRFVLELDLIERNYVRYLGLSQALKLSEPGFMEQFRRMLVSKLRVVFENASSELELWSRTASGQIDSQLRDRRRNFRRRRESLERIQAASGDLEDRLTELETQDQRAQEAHARVTALAQAVCDQVKSEPGKSADITAWRTEPTTLLRATA